MKYVNMSMFSSRPIQTTVSSRDSNAVPQTIPPKGAIDPETSTSLKCRIESKEILLAKIQLCPRIEEDMHREGAFPDSENYLSAHLLSRLGSKPIISAMAVVTMVCCALLQ